MQAYFNYAHNPVYDFAVGPLNRYRRLQEICIGKLEFEDNDKVLCVGPGTGNEIFRILEMNTNVGIAGIDYSYTVLHKTYKKVLALGKEIEKATSEILRGLKNGGQFVITYPSSEDGAKLGINLPKDSIRHNVNAGKNHFRAFIESLGEMLAGTVYLPLLLRPEKRNFSHLDLKAMIIQLTGVDFQIKENPVYQDFIAHGRKSNEGGKSNAY